MIAAFLLNSFVQKSFLTKIFFLFAEINLTARGPLYTCLVYLAFNVYYPSCRWNVMFTLLFSVTIHTFHFSLGERWTSERERMPAARERLPEKRLVICGIQGLLLTIATIDGAAEFHSFLTRTDGKTTHSQTDGCVTIFFIAWQNLGAQYRGKIISNNPFEEGCCFFRSLELINIPFFEKTFLDWGSVSLIVWFLYHTKLRRIVIWTFVFNLSSNNCNDKINFQKGIGHTRPLK